MLPFHPCSCTDTVKWCIYASYQDIDVASMEWCKGWRLCTWHDCKYAFVWYVLMSCERNEQQLSLLSILSVVLQATSTFANTVSHHCREPIVSSQLAGNATCNSYPLNCVPCDCEVLWYSSLHHIAQLVGGVSHLQSSWMSNRCLLWSPLSPQPALEMLAWLSHWRTEAHSLYTQRVFI